MEQIAGKKKEQNPPHLVDMGGGGGVKVGSACFIGQFKGFFTLICILLTAKYTILQTSTHSEMTKCGIP